jgi:hypothetical protein
MLRSMLAVSALGPLSALNITTDKHYVWMEYPDIITVVRSRRSAPLLCASSCCF